MLPSRNSSFPLFSLVAPVFLYFASMFIISPMTSQVVIDLVCYEQGTALDDDCGSAEISAVANWYILGILTAGNITAILSSGFYGTVSNRYGRILTTFLPFFGALINCTTVTAVAFFKPSNYLVYLIVAGFINGCTGMYSTFMMSTFSMIADITPLLNDVTDKHESDASSSKRVFAFSVIEITIFATKIIFPTVGGVLAFKYGFVIPLVVAWFLLLIGLCWIVFAMAESLPDPTSNSSARHRSNIIEPKSFCRCPQPLNRQQHIDYDIFRTFRNIGFLLFFKIDSNPSTTVSSHVPVRTVAPQIRGGTTSPLTSDDRSEISSLLSTDVPKSESLSEYVTLDSFTPAAATNRSEEEMLIRNLSWAFLLYYIAYMSVSSLLYVYVTHVLGWSPDIIGYYETTDAAINMFSVLGAPFLVNVVSRCLSSSYTNFHWYEVTKGIEPNDTSTSESLLGSKQTRTSSDATEIGHSFFKGKRENDSKNVDLSKDLTWIYVGYLFRGLHFCAFGVVRSTGWLFGLLGLLVAVGPSLPLTRSTISSRVSSVHQSQVFSGLSAMQSLASLLSPLVAMCYSWSLSFFPGTMFEVVGFLCLVSALAVVWIKK